MFLGNFYNIFHGWTTNIIGPLWSISVEEQFYIVFPLLLRTVGVDRLPIIGLACIAIGLIDVTFEGFLNVPFHIIWLNTFSNLMFFGTGIMCAVWKQTVEYRPSKRARLISAGAALVAFGCAGRALNFPTHDAMAHGAKVILGYGMTACACTLLFRSLTEVKYVFPEKLLFFGRISYGIYTYHWPISQTTEKVLANLSPWFRLLSAGPTLLVALLSYRWIETPFLRLKSTLGRIASGHPAAGGFDPKSSRLPMPNVGPMLADQK